ncbi:MAG: hypothetical protein RLZZ528_1751 [Pseudomonadota bacterium]
MPAMPDRPAPRYTRLTGEGRRAALVEAARACIARGGIQEFTVDRICAEAGVSRGLITHHFGSMNALLAAVYAAMYVPATTAAPDHDPARPHLAAMLDAFFDPAVFNREALTVWLALWGQVSVKDELAAEHRRRYAEYLGSVTAAIAALAAERSRQVDTASLAAALICLVDGLGVQHCIDPASMPPARALALCHALLDPSLGPF